MWQIKSSRKFTLDFTRHENETLFLESVSGRRRNYWKFLFSENFCGKWKKNMWKKVLRSRGKLKKSFGKMILLMTTTFAIFPHQKNRWHARNFKILSYSISNYGNVRLIWRGFVFLTNFLLNFKLTTFQVMWNVCDEGENQFTECAANREKRYLIEDWWHQSTLVHPYVIQWLSWSLMLWFKLDMSSILLQAYT